MAIYRLTRDEGKDPEDGSEINPVRDRALALLTRTDADLTDAELFAQQGDPFWYIDLCLGQLHRLPSEIDPLLLCREYTEIQAYHTVKRAMNELQMSRLRRE